MKNLISDTASCTSRNSLDSTAGHIQHRLLRRVVLCFVFSFSCTSFRQFSGVWHQTLIPRMDRHRPHAKPRQSRQPDARSGSNQEYCPMEATRLPPLTIGTWQGCKGATISLSEDQFAELAAMVDQVDPEFRLACQHHARFQAKKAFILLDASKRVQHALFRSISSIFQTYSIGDVACFRKDKQGRATWSPSSKVNTSRA